MLNLAGDSATTPQGRDVPSQHTIAAKVAAICPSSLSRTTPPGQGSRTLVFKAVLTFQIVPEFTVSDHLMACTREAQRICIADPQEGRAAVQIGARDQRL